MNEFKEAMKREQKRILRLVDLTADVENCDKHELLLLDKRGSRTYCYKRDCKGVKTYLGTAESEEARRLMRNRFLREKRKRLLKDQNLIEKVMQGYQDYSYDAVMSALPGSYRALADEDFNNKRYEEIKVWANDDYPVNEMPFPDAEIYTRDGRRVRSKGECLHLNILAELGIPARYDWLMTFEDQHGETKTLSPDIVIQCFNRSLVIIEHLGRLFNMGYSMKFGEKCYWYQQGGFVLGKNFFVTSDDKYGGTDSQAIWQVALEVERLFYGD